MLLAPTKDVNIIYKYIRINLHASQSAIYNRIEQNRIEYVYLSIKDAHDRQYNYMKITIFTLIGMIRLIGFSIQDIQIHVNIQFCNQ